jgi:hypothetical protein
MLFWHRSAPASSEHFGNNSERVQYPKSSLAQTLLNPGNTGNEEDDVWYHYYDAQAELEHLEYELGHRYGAGGTPDESIGEGDRPPERPLPLWQVTAWIGGLWAISMGLGLASQWLVH